MGETRRDRLFDSGLGFDILDFDDFAVDTDASLLRFLRTVVLIELEGLVVVFDFGRPTGRGGENAGLALFAGAISEFATQNLCRKEKEFDKLKVLIPRLDFW